MVDDCRRPAAPRAARARSRASSPTPAHVALAPRRDAVAQPMLLVDDLPVELVARRAPPPRAAASRQASKSAKPLVEAARAAAVEPDRRARQVLQEAAVMADERRGPSAAIGEFASRAIRSPAGRDGWSARRAAGCRAPARARGRAPRGAPRRRRAAPGSSSPVEAEVVEQTRARDRRSSARPRPAST